jgi:hypothetical protein
MPTFTFRSEDSPCRMLSKRSQIAVADARARTPCRSQRAGSPADRSRTGTSSSSQGRSARRMSSSTLGFSSGLAPAAFARRSSAFDDDHCQSAAVTLGPSELLLEALFEARGVLVSLCHIMKCSSRRFKASVTNLRARYEDLRNQKEAVRQGGRQSHEEERALIRANQDRSAEPEKFRPTGIR